MNRKFFFPVRVVLAALLCYLPTVCFFPTASYAEQEAEIGQSQVPFVAIFNGTDLSGWRIPKGDNGHWRVVDGVIDYDAKSESLEEKSLWSEGEYEDFVLQVDWRIKETPWINPYTRIVMPDGREKKGADGEDIMIAVPDSDSGIFLRGDSKAQVNIWCWPVGSGEVYSYRKNMSLSPEVRAAVTPRSNADHDIGQWNTFEITMRGDRLSVKLNGVQVIENAQLPGIPSRGPIGLQHHGGKDEQGDWHSPPSLVQFRNLRIKPL